MRQRFSGVFLLFLSAGSALWSGDEDWTRIPLRFATIENMVADGGLVRLGREYTQEGDKPIVMEGEEASRLELKSSDIRIVADKTASNGHYVHHVKTMEFRFRVETPGAYRARIRAWFPLQAPYNHNESMDDGGVHNIVDSDHREPGVWLWTDGPTYALSRGEHRYLFPSPAAFCGGARFDKIVLLPEGQTVADGPELPASPLISPSTGQLISRRLKLTKVRRWKAQYESTPNGGSVEIDYAYDAPEKWAPLTPDVARVVPTPKPRYLYYRIRMAGTNQTMSPRLEGFQILIRKEPPPPEATGKDGMAP